MLSVALDHTSDPSSFRVARVPPAVPRKALEPPFLLCQLYSLCNWFQPWLGFHIAARALISTDGIIMWAPGSTCGCQARPGLITGQSIPAVRPENGHSELPTHACSQWASQSPSGTEPVVGACRSEELTSAHPSPWWQARHPCFIHSCCFLTTRPLCT